MNGLQRLGELAAKMRAEIITIGSELLLGEIVDTNTAMIARHLREIGIDVHHSATVGDDIESIAQALRAGLERVEAVITTGGLGPTVDDPTREAIAQAAGVPLIFMPTLWEEIKKRYAKSGRTPTENTRQQAYFPKHAIPLPNPVGTAPAFILEMDQSTVIALPGVPAEMVYLLEQEVVPYLRSKYDLDEIIRTRLLRTAGVGESWLDAQIQDLAALRNPTIGLAAHPGSVDIRIKATGSDEKKVNALIEEVETTLRQRLGEIIFGVDQETLESIVLRALRNKGWNIAVVESGTGGELSKLLSREEGGFLLGIIVPEQKLNQAESLLEKVVAERAVEVSTALSVSQKEDFHHIDLAIHLQNVRFHKSHIYSGPPDDAARWAANLTLNTLRKHLR